jgi:hypothetical protein
VAYFLPAENAKVNFKTNHYLKFAELRHAGNAEQYSLGRTAFFSLGDHPTFPNAQFQSRLARCAFFLEIPAIGHTPE